MKILICNVGSTSLKYRLLDMDNNEHALAVGKMERVGAAEGFFAHKDDAGRKLERTLPIADHGEGIRLMLEQLVGGVVASLEEISCVGFKVVHARGITGVQLLDEKVRQAMAEFNCIAPAHNPPYIAAIEHFARLMPGVPLIGSFETGFHAQLPPKAYLYSIPKELEEQYGIRRYGFHGASHEYVADMVEQLMGKSGLKVVTCHLGGSGSLCAVNSGQSVDTTLGFSLQSGIMHNNRCGDIDPYIPLYLMEELGMSLQEVKDLLNKKSGFLGLSGVSNDLRDIEQAAQEGNVDAQNCIDAYCYSLKKLIGGYACAMGGLDAIAFAGGIGENSPLVRKLVCEDLEFLGVRLDDARNQLPGYDREVSADGSPVKVYVVATNEEIVVARKARDYLAAQGN